MLLAVLLFFCTLQDSVPYKPEDEFAIKFAFSFNKRGEVNPDDRDDRVPLKVASPTYDRPDNPPLPFIKVSLELIKKSSDEIKLKIVRDNVQVNKKKLTESMKLAIFSGFTDDIKDQISGYSHIIYFLDKENKPLSKIVIEFDEDGFYLVNGVRKGKL